MAEKMRLEMMERRLRIQNPFPKLDREAARNDINVFIEAIMRDERTGVPLKQAPVHRAWHSLADEHDRLLVWASISHGKSSQISIARTLWLLGRDPTTRIAIISHTAAQAHKLLRSIRRYIESSEELHAIFPDLRPMADQWTSSAITVQRNTLSKDPSVQACGQGGNILGSRLDHLIIDDLLNTSNTATADQRDKCFEWVQSDCLSRLEEGSRVLVIGTAFHPDDALHRLARLPGWKAVRYPVLNDDGTPRWPERWSMERIATVKDTLGPLEFARQLLCVARSDDESRFKKEWIDRCLARGNGKTLCYGMDNLPPGFKTYTGVDLAVQQKDASDSTCLFTIAVHPNGDREVLNIEAGKWSGPDIVQRIIDAHKRYMSVCIVENNACFPPGTRVLTKRGYKAIEDVEVGDEVWTHKARWRRVTDTLAGTSRTLTTARAEGHASVRPTPNHWFWMRRAGRNGPTGAAQWISYGVRDEPAYAAVARPGKSHGWAKVPDIEDAPYERYGTETEGGPVHNLVVEEDESYTVEDFLVHNAQDFIIQFARNQFAVPIRPFTTGRNKAHPEFGIESIAAEMAGGKWIIPSNNGTPAHPEIFNWIQEMLFYSPSAHTGDRLMSSYFCREGARMASQTITSARVDVLSR
jgi:hypothetical protein